MRGTRRGGSGSGPTRADAEGLRRFVGFALAPNERGFCGPEDHDRLVRWLDQGTDSGIDDATMASLARAFDGPLPYLEVIAEANRLDDPFDPQVVEAYWIGNDLLGAVKPRLLVKRLLRDFAGAPTVDPARIEATAADAVPHHAYHVLVTYPWIDVIADGRTSAIRLLDSCRIRVGTVESIDGDQVTARSRHWTILDGRIADSPPTVESYRQVSRATGSWLSPGDSVALHWDHLVDRLIPAQAQDLRRITTRTVSMVNATLLGPDLPAAP